jgi:putative ABC transport system permease protein
MGTLLQDVRYGLRMLGKAPGFAAIAVLTLALGIGANTAIYTAVDRILLRPLPYAQPERLVVLWEDFSRIGFPRNNLSPADYVDWKNQNSVFEDVAATRSRVATLTMGGPPEMVIGRGVTANFFSVLGVSPLIGRTFTEAEDKAQAPVVLLSYKLWQRRYGGDAGVIGRSIAMNGAQVTVIGVMPASFAYPRRAIKYWVPANFTPADLANRGSHFLGTVARLKPGVSLDQARAEMQTIAKRLEIEYPSTNANVAAVVRPLREQIVGEIQRPLLVLLAAAGFVLLIASSNLANLLLARATGRRREMAVRTALGASRKRLVRQILTESFLLSALGAFSGLLLARWGMVVLEALVPSGIPDSELGLNGQVLLFAAAIAIGTAILFGLPSALQGAGVSMNEVLKQGSRAGATGRSKILRNVLVISQVALALMLLVGAGLLLKTFARLRSVDPGFRPDNVLTIMAELPRQKYSTDASRVEFFDQAEQRIRALPGVQGAGFASDLPFTSQGDTDGFRIEGRPEPRSNAELDALYREVTNDYLQTIGARLLEGRLFDSRDGASSQRAVIINETFAKGFWPGESPVGKRMQVGKTGPDQPWLTIVGVVADMRERGLLLAMKPGMYVPVKQIAQPDPSYLAVRTAGDPLALAGAVREAVWAVDREQPVSNVRTMRNLMEEETGSQRQVMTLLGIFAALALLLASLGIYGVLSYAVAQRTQEIGIRMALGAGPLDVLRMVVAQGLEVALVGVGMGLVGALALTRVMAGMLFEVSATDPATFAAVALFLTMIAAAACYLPARRASRVNPIIALRYE